MAPSPAPGEAKMWELAASFPRQLQDGLKAVPRHNFAERPGATIPIVAMGGSGIAGELLAHLAERDAESAIVPCRDFHLPGWLTGPFPAIFVSYSGNTAETLAAYDEAKRRGVTRAVVASGGALVERARADQALCVQVPPGLPPRSSLGYLFGGLSGVLRHAVPFVAKELPTAAASLEKLGRSLASDEGEPARLAEAWGEKDLWVYAPEVLGGVARRWKTQCEENTKRLAHFDTVPELLHNAFVAWDALPRGEADRRFVVALRGGQEGEEIARRMDYLAAEVRAKGVPVQEVRAVSRGLLASTLELVWTGDYLSLWGARRRGVDPLPVPPIDRMKQALAAPPRSG